MTRAMVTIEQFEGVKTLLKTKTQSEIMNEHIKYAGQKHWSIDGLNSLTTDQMALLLYNPNLVTVEPSLEDHLRDAYIGAKSQDFAEGLVKAATLYGINPSLFEGLVEWVPDDQEPVANPDQA